MGTFTTPLLKTVRLELAMENPSFLGFKPWFIHSLWL